MKDRFLAFCKDKLADVHMGSPGSLTAACPYPHATGSGLRGLSVSYEKGCYHCFSCGAHGNAAQLMAHVLGTPYAEAKGALGLRPKKAKEVPIDVVRKRVEELLSHQEVLTWLRKYRGFTQETIYARNLGYNHEERRVTIPVYDEWLRPVDMRRHLIDKTRKEPKDYPFEKGFALPRIYLASEVEEKPDVVLFEGELDAILASQLGFPACSTAGMGAGSWAPVLSRHFAGKRVWVCYDCDDAGVRGGQKVAGEIAQVADEVRIVRLELDAPRKDFTDYIVEEGHSPEEFQLLLDRADVYSPESAAADTDVVDTDLVSTSRADLYGKCVRFKALIAGKDLAPFIFPKVLHARCNQGRKPEICAACGLSATAGDIDLTVDDRSDAVLTLIGIENADQKSEIARMLGLQKCHLWDFKIEQAENIEALRLIPAIDYGAEHTEYTIREAYYLGHGLSPNSEYEFCGVAGVDPRNQLAVPVLWGAAPSKGSLEKRPLTDAEIGMLQVFQVGG